MLKYNKDVDSETKGNNVFMFTGPTCGQCKMVKPRIEKLAATKEDFNFYEVDTSTEDGINLAQRYGISMLPSMVVMSTDEPTVLAGAGQVVNVGKIL